MRQLNLDHVVAEAQLVQHGGRDAAETMTCHSVLEAHALQRRQDRVVRHRPFVAAPAGKHKVAQATQLMQSGEHFHCLG